ncbi:MAG: hypothetical protein DIU78_012050 [Pseudomonadota bacterium]
MTIREYQLRMVNEVSAEGFRVGIERIGPEPVISDTGGNATHDGRTNGRAGILPAAASFLPGSQPW